MPLHPVRLPLRVLHRVRRPEQAPDEGIDQPAHGRRDRLEPFADGPADFAQGALDLFAGRVAKVGGGGEYGACYFL